MALGRAAPSGEGQGPHAGRPASGHRADGANQGLTGPRHSSVEGPIYSFLVFLCLIHKQYNSATVTGAPEIFAGFIVYLPEVKKKHR